MDGGVVELEGKAFASAARVMTIFWQLVDATQGLRDAITKWVEYARYVHQDMFLAMEVAQDHLKPLQL